MKNCVKRLLILLASIGVLICGIGVKEVHAAENQKENFYLNQESVRIGERKRVYPVKEGDYLKKIAVEVYGSTSYWELLYEENRELIGDNPHHIEPDMYLVLPQLPQKNLTWEAIYEKDERTEESPAYEAQIADDVSYSIEEHYYYKNEKDSRYGSWEKDEGYFDIVYPQIVFDDGRDASLINKEIRDCAMFMVNQMYLHPMEWLMENCRTDDLYGFDWRISEVTYQITYMDDHLLSVVFYDDMFIGSIYGESYEMRGLIIDLNTGHAYTRDEIFTGREELAKEVHAKIQEIYVDDERHYRVFDETMDETLFSRLMETEEWVDGRYCGVMFLDRNGVNLGLSFRASSNGLLWRGYETAAFSMEELTAYQSDSAFWNSILHLAYTDEERYDYLKDAV